MFNVRPTLVAMTLIASLAVAHAQTTPQDHDAHHPDTAAPVAPTAPAPGAPQAGMSGMDMGRMMSGNMEQMMSMMMRRMMAMDDTPGMMGGMGPGGRMMGGWRHIEGQIAFVKAELHLTDAQMPQWNAFADALRSNAKKLQETGRSAMMMPGSALAPFPDQLAARRQVLSAELDSLQGIEPAARALYGVLSAEQKKMADELMADHLRRM